MAKAPTSEEVARMILRRFRELDARAGRAIIATQRSVIIISNKITADEFISGREYAVENGWIEIDANGSMKLTDAGFSEM